MNVLYSDRKHFKLWSGNLDNGLLVEGKNVKYRNGFLDKNCKALRTAEIKK
jgi:hypothetical protein